MKITNHQNLPASLVAAIEHDERDREGCDYTITELIKPPRILALERKHAAELTEDASDRIWSLMGRAGHEVLRKYGIAAGKAIVEERVIVPVMVDGKSFIIGGQLDYASTEDQSLIDFKITSVWAIKEGVKTEWCEQLNLYRWLAAHYGVVVNKLQIIAIARDWSVREAQHERGSDYPQQQVKVFGVPMWSDEVCESFLQERIRAHENAKVELPLCLPNEMWEKPARFALMKVGRKKAVKLYDTFEAADAEVRGDLYYTERRPGERPRCESYCVVAPHCQQWKAYQASQEQA